MERYCPPGTARFVPANTTIISWVRRGEVWLPGFNVKTAVVSGATFVVSSGNNNSSRASPIMEAR